MGCVNSKKIYTHQDEDENDPMVLELKEHFAQFDKEGGRRCSWATWRRCTGAAPSRSWAPPTPSAPGASWTWPAGVMSLGLISTNGS
ncbi:unnamed protein product [Heterosigma akashiwo]